MATKRKTHHQQIHISPDPRSPHLFHLSVATMQTRGGMQTRGLDKFIWGFDNALKRAESYAGRFDTDDIHRPEEPVRGSPEEIEASRVRFKADEEKKRADEDKAAQVKSNRQIKTLRAAIADPDKRDKLESVAWKKGPKPTAEVKKINRTIMEVLGFKPNIIKLRDELRKAAAHESSRI